MIICKLQCLLYIQIADHEVLLIRVDVIICLIRKDSRYTEKDAAIVVRQMLKVAAECHLHGLVHRDMKPEVCKQFNTTFGLVMLIDIAFLKQTRFLVEFSL